MGVTFCPASLPSYENVIKKIYTKEQKGKEQLTFLESGFTNYCDVRNCLWFRANAAVCFSLCGKIK
jgi:hypothetical protein